MAELVILLPLHCTMHTHNMAEAIHNIDITDVIVTLSRKVAMTSFAINTIYVHCCSRHIVGLLNNFRSTMPTYWCAWIYTNDLETDAVDLLYKTLRNDSAFYIHNMAS